MTGITGRGNKHTVNQAIAIINKVGLRHGAYTSFYKDFKIRLLALSTIDVSNEAR